MAVNDGYDLNFRLYLEGKSPDHHHLHDGMNERKEERRMGDYAKKRDEELLSHSVVRLLIFFLGESKKEEKGVSHLKMLVNLIILVCMDM